ncbi:hypothetical protein RB597_009019 [Gaeumannomyces tritici]
MASRSRSRDDHRRSRSPVSDRSAGGSKSPRNRRSPSRGRSRSPSRYSRSPSPRRNGRYHDSRSRSRSRSRSGSLSPGRGRDTRMRSRSRGASKSPAPRNTKIVVERLTKNVNEDHLQEIFGTYGQIVDLDLPVNRQLGTNRGTAYILYAREPDAEAAIAHMHEGQIDGATVNVSIVLPKRKFSTSPPVARRGNPHINPRHIEEAARVGGLASSAVAGRGGARGGRSNRDRSPPTGPAAEGGGRYSHNRSDVYRPRSLSRSRSPVEGGKGTGGGGGGGGTGGYRSRSNSPHSARSESRSRRRGGGGAGGGGGGRRRSPSRGSFSSYDRRSRSRSASRGRGGRGYR